VSKVRYVLDPCTKAEAEILSGVIHVLQHVLRGNLVALVMRDDNGLFVALRPGEESESARSLAELPWAALQRVAEEHMS
jgi:hypothetical protein